MTIAELQTWVDADWQQRSRERPSVELQLLYIIEEFGEVAEAIRKNNGSKARKQGHVDLGSEFADLLVSITTLANHFKIDLSKEVERFKAKLAERHTQGF